MPQVEAIIKKLQLPDDWRARVLELANETDHRAEIEQERKQLTEALARYGKLYAWGDISEEQYRNQRDTIQERLFGLVVPERGDVEGAAQKLESLAELWDAADDTDRQEICRALFSKVVVDVPEREVVCVQPKPEFAPLFRAIPGLVEREGCFYARE